MRILLATQPIQQPRVKRILQPGVTCWSIEEVCNTGLLIDGRDYYRAFYHAARTARRYILIAGWQFDSAVDLLRGDDLKEADTDVRFLSFLNGLCEKNPELHVYILAWDFNVLFALEREWGQDRIFNWGTNDRLQFRFDDCHPLSASHHQKFVVVDGHLAFVGGTDICAQRWDDRCHRAEHPDRTDADARPYGPYHDIQSYHIGPVARQLAELFTLRWRQSGGGVLTLPPSPPAYEVVLEPSVALAATQVGLSRTHPPMLVPPQKAVQEIRCLYLDAIATAEQVIYIENQYFSSQAIYAALVGRLRATRRPRLQIVMILPKRPKALSETIAVGFAQAKLLCSLQDIARQTGHALGIYYTTATAADGQEKPTYIHAKLLLVDDRFLTVGSANTTNRSMGLDTEVNVSWEASYGQEALIQSIRQARVSLLAEHAGVDPQQEGYRLSRTTGLVEYLNHLADRAHSRLRHHPMDRFLDENAWLQALKPKNLALDPEQPFFIWVPRRGNSLGLPWGRATTQGRPYPQSDRGAVTTEQ